MVSALRLVFALLGSKNLFLHGHPTSATSAYGIRRLCGLRILLSLVERILRTGTPEQTQGNRLDTNTQTSIPFDMMPKSMKAACAATCSCGLFLVQGPAKSWKNSCLDWHKRKRRRTSSQLDCKPDVQKSSIKWNNVHKFISFAFHMLQQLQSQLPARTQRAGLPNQSLDL